MASRAFRNGNDLYQEATVSEDAIGPLQAPEEEIKIDISAPRAKAIARLEKDKVSLTLKGLPATPQTGITKARYLTYVF